MKKYIIHTAAAALLLIGIAACQQAEELGTGALPAAITATVPAPPAWLSSPQVRGGGSEADGGVGASPDTRHATNDATGTVTWAEGDMLHATITFHHKSGLVSDPVPITINLGTGTTTDATWPVGNHISHATLTGLYGYTDHTATQRVGTSEGINPIYRATGTGQYGKPIAISLHHHNTAQVTFSGMPSGTALSAGDISYTTTAAGNTKLYPILAADATQVTGTVAGEPFAIPAGQGGPIGKMYSVENGKDAGGRDPGDVRIQAATADFLAWATSADVLTTNYTLKYHIDLSAISNWTRIGTSSSAAYTGVFDGAGYTIKGLTLSASSNYQGLFGYISGATIANVTLVNPQVKSTGSYYTGALVGRADSSKTITITNCHVTGGSVTGRSYTSGLVGYASGTHMVNCSASTTVEGTTYVGGLVGSASGAIIACHSAGTVTATDAGARVGGLVGTNGATTCFCYSTATVTATATTGTPSAGGLMGRISSSASYINSCYATGSVTIDAGATGTSTGSLLGYTDFGTPSYCNATGSAPSGNLIGNKDPGTNTAHTAPAQIKATLAGYTGSRTVRMYDSVAPTDVATKTSTYTFTSAIWKDDLTFDWDTVKKQ